MKRETSIALSERLRQRVLSNTSDEAPGMMEEPASVYLDPGRWQRERQQFFLDTPQVIGFAGEVAAPGSYMAAEVMQVPIVVTRDERGELRAFVNACAHRGARVASGCGTGKRLTCAYHGWSYGFDGKLAGRPGEAAFEAPGAGTCLRSLPVSDRAGLLVVGVSPGMDQALVDGHLDEIAPQLEDLGFDRMQSVQTRRFDVAANWKLVVDLSHESYHFACLHRDSLSPLMSSHAIVDEFGRHSRWAFPMKGIEQALGGPRGDWPERPPGVINHTLFPGTVVVVPPRDAQLIRVEPGADPGRSVVFYSGVCADPERMEESRQAYEFGGDIFETEDLVAAAQCQQGLAAGQRSVLFGRNEPIVQFWHRLWADALR